MESEFCEEGERQAEQAALDERQRLIVAGEEYRS